MAEWRDLDSLKLWERNYNVSDVDYLKNLFRTFGFNGSLEVWNGVVMSGNHSLQGLRELRAEKWTPTGSGIRIEKGKWQVDCGDISHLSKTKAEAFALADNVSPRKASPDYARMGALVRETHAADPTAIEVVFTDAELAELEELGRVADGLTADLDDAPGEGKRVGLEKAKQVKVVVAVKDLPTIERAIDATGEINRGAALLLLCEAYLNAKS